MKIAGYILVAFGLVDLIGSFIEIDVWGDWFQITLPGILWSLSAYIEMALGYFLISLGSKDTEPSSSE